MACTRIWRRRHERVLVLPQHVQLGDWHPRQILKTAETTEQQRMSGDSVSQWAQACIEADAVIGAARAYGRHHADLGPPISAETLRKAYNGFCQAERPARGETEAFGKACAEMFGPRQAPTGAPDRHRQSKRRPWGYHVPKGNKWQEKVDARLGIEN